MAQPPLPKKTHSMTSETYETLKTDGHQYVNVADREDYVSPSPSGASADKVSNPGPPTPPRPASARSSLGSERSVDLSHLPRSLDTKPPLPPGFSRDDSKPPPPPVREDSRVSLSQSDGVLFSKEVSQFPNGARGKGSPGQNGPRTRVFKRDLTYAGVPYYEKDGVRKKHHAFDSGIHVQINFRGI